MLILHMVYKHFGSHLGAMFGLEGDFGFTWHIGVVHVVGDHGWVGSPSEMHALHLFVSPSMYMFLSRYMFRVRVNF